MCSEMLQGRLKMCQLDCGEQQDFIVLSQEQLSERAVNCTLFRLLVFFLCIKTKPNPPQPMIILVSRSKSLPCLLWWVRYVNLLPWHISVHAGMTPALHEQHTLNEQGEKVNILFHFDLPGYLW